MVNCNVILRPIYILWNIESFSRRFFQGRFFQFRDDFSATLQTLDNLAPRFE